MRESLKESESINSVSFAAQTTWLHLSLTVDDWGRCEASIKLLRPKLFPLRLEQVRETELARWIAECEKAGLLRLYQAEGKEYVQMMKWEVGRAEKSRCPDPPEEIRSICYLRTVVNGRIQRKAVAPDSDPDSDSDKRVGANGSRPPPGKPELSDEEWLRELGKDPHYGHVRVRDEYGKMQRWCQVNHRQPTRRRFVNWLNRIERPLARGDREPASKIIPRPQPEGWIAWCKRTYPDSRETDFWRVPDDVKREFQDTP
jgi:hypothetical protein